MNSPGQCAQIRPELGVYVLGAIAPADRAVVKRHLVSCPRCREEVAELAGLPAQLRKVPVADAMQLSGERQPDHSASAEGYDAATGVSAAVRYTPKPWGTELKASVSDIRPGTPCQIWATTVSGQQAAAGGWTVTRSDPRAWYPASVPFPAASLASFRITAHGNILVTISLHPGTQPTSARSGRCR